MIRLPNLTSAALLDHVQALLLRTAHGRHGLPARAYLAEETGRVTLVDLPALDGAADHSAAGAVLGTLMREHRSSYAVLQLPHRTPEGTEGIGLYAVAADGDALGQRLLSLERRLDGRIARLLRHAVSAAPAASNEASAVG
jgi:hypothetical protein